MKKEQLENGVARLLREIATDTPLHETPTHGTPLYEVPADLERWESLSFETASDDEARTMRAEAARSHEAARRWQAYRPVEPAMKQRLLESVQHELNRPEAGASESTAVEAFLASPEEQSSLEAPESLEAEADDADEIPQSGKADAAGEIKETDGPDASEILQFPGAQISPGRGQWFVPAVASLAAALLWVVIWPRPIAQLPEYELAAESGSHKIRSQALPSVDGSLALALDDTFEIVLRPAIAVDHEVTTAVFAERLGSLEPVELRTEISESGSIRLSGRFDRALRLDREVVDLWIVVAAEGAIPPTPDLLRESGRASPEQDWRLLRFRLQQDDSSKT